jgi:hypothetical protein
LSRDYKKRLEKIASTDNDLPMRILDGQDMKMNQVSPTEEFHRDMRKLGRPNRIEICYDYRAQNTTCRLVSQTYKNPKHLRCI